MRVPVHFAAARRVLCGFIEDEKSTGFVASLITKYGVRGVAVAPPKTTS